MVEIEILGQITIKLMQCHLALAHEKTVRDTDPYYWRDGEGV